jgi:DNA-directed RNA polymerase specialized sigma24 family protein
MDASQNVTRLLAAWSSGDAAALEALTPVIQNELHRLAARQMAGERPGHLLQPTALVNEAYLRLVNWKDVQWQNRAHFFGTAAQLMRRVLVDMARARGRALDDALKALEEVDARKSRVVELRYFGGLSHEEAALVMGVSVATVRRDWSLARAWLFRELNRQ